MRRVGSLFRVRLVVPDALRHGVADNGGEDKRGCLWGCAFGEQDNGVGEPYPPGNEQGVYGESNKIGPSPKQGAIDLLFAEI